MRRRYFSDSNGVFSVGDLDHWDLVWLDVKTEWNWDQEIAEYRRRLARLTGGC
jgi:hypothetical protein